MDLEKLIELVRENEFLYNFNDKNYHDTQKKDVVWRKIGQKLKQTDKECKKQWNALRDGFRRNLKRRKTTSGQAAITSKEWKFEGEMSFLKPYLKDRSTTSSSNMTILSEETEQTQENNEDIPQTERKDAVQQTDFRKTKIKPTQKNTASAVLMQYILKEKSKNEKQDEIETLFYSLAQTVKKFSPYYRAIARAQICSTVSELEIKNMTQPYPVQSNASTPMPSPESYTSVSNTPSHMELRPSPLDFYESFSKRPKSDTSPS